MPNFAVKAIEAASSFERALAVPLLRSAVGHVAREPEDVAVHLVGEQHGEAPHLVLHARGPDVRLAELVVRLVGRVLHLEVDRAQSGDSYCTAFTRRSWKRAALFWPPKPMWRRRCWWR
jgi:hypothetical protein